MPFELLAVSSWQGIITDAFPHSLYPGATLVLEFGLPLKRAQTRGPDNYKKKAGEERGILFRCVRTRGRTVQYLMAQARIRMLARVTTADRRQPSGTCHVHTATWQRKGAGEAAFLATASLCHFLFSDLTFDGLWRERVRLFMSPAAVASVSPTVPLQ